MSAIRYEELRTEDRRAEVIVPIYGRSIYLRDQIYNLTYYIGNIKGNVTWDQVRIYVNGEGYYTSPNYTSDGVHYVPLSFASAGQFNVSLRSTDQSNTYTVQYSVGSLNQLITFLGISLPWWLWIIVIAIGAAIVCGFIAVIVKIAK